MFLVSSAFLDLGPICLYVHPVCTAGLQPICPPSDQTPRKKPSPPAQQAKETHVCMSARCWHPDTSTGCIALPAPSHHSHHMGRDVLGCLGVQAGMPGRWQAWGCVTTSTLCWATHHHTPGVLSPVLGFSAQEGHGHGGERPVKGHKKDEGTGAPFL